MLPCDEIVRHSRRRENTEKDEAQFNTTPEKADALGKLFVESIELAGRHFGMRCPTTGEFKAGANWAETH
ncbi:hypothetical protein [uncultured Bilophila sp.]|uniref:hypothetical protein n=1 Tax=uncultured Bilophila sp. TaxID=529385 RepID=UPI00267098D4|nr:hypothetical protein [uncultured Bilophila sp.]